jgi:hypothetical protein
MSQDPAGAADDLTTAFVQFASGFDTLKDRRNFLEQHHQLLTAPAIDAANAHILDWRDKGFAKSSLLTLRLFRNLLKRAIEVGVETAFLEAEPSREVTAAVSALLRADAGHDLFSTIFVNRNQLTSPQATGAFHYLRAKYEDEPDKLTNVEACWDAIGMFRGDTGARAHNSHDLRGKTQ